MLLAIFNQILILSFASSVVALAILLVRALLWHRVPAKLQYAVWALLLIRLVLPVLPSSPITVFNIHPTAQLSVQNINSAGSKGISLGATGGKTNTAADTSGQGGSTAAPQLPPKNAPAFQPGINFETASYVWLLGMILILLYYAVINIAVRVSLSGREICRDGAALEVLEDCRRRIGLRRSVTILGNFGTESPAVFGIFRPRIIVSKSLTENADPDTLKYIFLHELTHIKRHDNAVNLLAMLLGAVNWFNPLLWFAFHKMKEDCEVSCDASVLVMLSSSEKREYGYTIVNMLQAMPYRFIPGAAGFTGSFTKRRIIMIARGKKTSIIVTAIALTLILLAGCASLPAKDVSAAGLTSSNSGSSAVDTSNASSMASPPAVSGANSGSSSLASAATSSSKFVTASNSSGWVYYLKNTGSANKIFRRHPDGTGEMQVSDISPNGYVVSDDWIYYCDANGAGIYKMHGDGSGRVKLSSNTGSPAAVDGSYLYLYYQSKSDPDTSDACSYLYRIKLDGTSLQEICNTPVIYGVALANGFIYYSNFDDNASLYRMRTDGSDKKKLTSDKTGAAFSIYNNAIYYINHGTGSFDGPGSIYKMNLDGSGKKTIGLNNSEQFRISDGMIYCLNSSNKFIKANLDGTGATVLDSNSWEITRVFGYTY